MVASRWADGDNWPRVREAFFGTAPWYVQVVVVPQMRREVIGALRARDIWRAGHEACWDRLRATIEQLEARAPRHGFWISGTVTGAEVALLAQLASLRTPLTPRQAGWLASLPRLTSYLDRVDAATRRPRTWAVSAAA